MRSFPIFTLTPLGINVPHTLVKFGIDFVLKGQIFEELKMRSMPRPKALSTYKAIARTFMSLPLICGSGHIADAAFLMMNSWRHFR